MSHQRTTIRNALLAILKGTTPTWATAASDNVYTNRVHNLNNTKLPAILINDGSETASPRDLRSALYIRKLTMKIEIKVEATSGYDEDLDDIAKQIEDLISSDRTLSGTASTCQYIGMEPSFDAGEKVIGILTLTYEIQYIT